ncbi:MULTISPECIES: hypothetical protein [Cryobacterium]|uniref:hypothetical protein n=1 Tax=Cryobacterium TaxID=69578 RepID=UPI0013FE4E42|nr:MULTISPECIES: hypothetical protein [Cryobacterium]
MVIVGGGRRGVGRMASAACVGGLLLGAAGCTAAPKPAPPSPTPTITPIFASDEEALAAATEAYAKYLRASDEILMDGGQNPERIREFTSTELAKSEIGGYREAQAQNLRSTGGSAFSNFTIQSVEPGPGTKDVVTAYVCSDVSVVDVLNEAGESVVSADRPDRTPFEITFDLTENSTPRLVVASAAVWKGDGVCG